MYCPLHSINRYEVSSFFLVKLKAYHNWDDVSSHKILYPSFVLFCFTSCDISNIGNYVVCNNVSEFYWAIMISKFPCMQKQRVSSIKQSYIHMTENSDADYVVFGEGSSPRLENFQQAFNSASCFPHIFYQVSGGSFGVEV